ncbi:MAG TPA: TPM domain-containing protein [Xanthobacteraceae bacterium]|nr:TPM domain-containing protein [Xanthobacteraceae bacterium]
MPSLRLKIRAAALALVAALAIGLPASAQTFPRLSGRVVDDATVLDTAMRDGIAQRLKALEDQTSDQVVVATVRSLQGYSVEDYANRLFRAWRLGQKDKNNGVLLLIAPTEHKVRIEVGYGLEGTLTDAVAKLIIESHLIPWLRQSRYDVAASTGVDDIVDVLAGHAAEWQQRARARPSGPHVHDVGVIQPGSFLSILLLVVFGGAFLLFFGMIGFAILTAILRLLVFVHLLPHAKDRQGGWSWLNRFDPPVDPRSLRRSHRSSSSSSSFWSASSFASWSSSSSSDSFSGGGGSSGGGGASGSW